MRRLILRLFLFQPAGRQGSILVVTLWALSLLTIFVLSTAYGVRQKIRVVQYIGDKDKLHFIGEAGVKLALAKLKEEDLTPDFDALNEEWSNNIGLFKNVKIGEGSFTVSYEYTDPLSNMKKIRYGLIDEERKININKASQKVMRRLFQRVVGLDYKDADDLAAAIIDWRDSDDEPLLNGAENFYYHGLRWPYSSKDAEFETLEELLLVRDMSREIFDRVKQYITVFGGGEININTVSREVLISLGLGESVVKKIILFRSGPDEQEATEDDNVFTSPFSIVSQLSQTASLSSSEIAEISNLVASGIFSTTSNNFMIMSTAKLDKTETSNFKIICIFERKDENKKGKIRYWREG